MPLSFAHTHSRLLAARAIGIFKNILSWNILRHKILSYIYGTRSQERGKDRITTTGPLTPHTHDALDSLQFGPPLSSLGHIPSPSTQSYKKKALLVGVRSTKGQTNTVPTNPLKGPHKDILDTREFLIEHRNYNPADITMLIDNDEPDQAQPTEENIKQSCKDLIAGARKGDRFFFLFAGHTTQKEAKGDEEEDGKDEFILTSDGKEIQDNILREMLVDPLPKGASLVAVFDACNSGTLLDLHHYRCNRVYVPWVNKGLRRTQTLRNGVVRQGAIVQPLRTSSGNAEILVSAINLSPYHSWVIESPTTLPANVVAETFVLPREPPRRSATIAACSTSDGSGTRWYTNCEMTYCDSPRGLFCGGNCKLTGPQPQSSDMADVICLSSAKDSQRSWEDPQGASLTQALLKKLTLRPPGHTPDTTIEDVLTSVSHELHATYVNMHQVARTYKRRVRDVNIRRRVKERSLIKRLPVETDNFQDPQES